jgi:hypothetical protein
MAYTLDHAVIAVNELDKAVTDFEAVGFSVMRGGQHEDMGTSNALILLQDKKYLELLAPTPGKPKEEITFRGIGTGKEGFAGVALLADHLYDRVRDLNDRGVDVSPMRDGSRVRPDGVRIEWRMAMLADTMTPFFMEDRTDRNLRVPAEPRLDHHENEVLGIEQLIVLSDNFESDVQFYQDLFGKLPHIEDERAVFELEGISYIVRTPESDDEKEYLRKGLSPLYEIGLRTENFKRAGLLNVGQTHGARLSLASQADVKHINYSPPRGINLEED